MFDLGHFGDQIGDLDDFVLGVAAGDDDVLAGGAVFQRFNDLVERQVVVAQADVEFVEQDHLVVGVGDQFFCPVPGLAGGGKVALAVLGFPGEAIAHGVDRDLIGEMFEDVALAGVPFAFDELDDADLEAVGDAAEYHAEGGSGFALALAGVDDEQALFIGVRLDQLVAGRLFLFHLFGVIGVALGLGHEVGLFGSFGHFSSSR